jgi:putative tryptophan/tyrosine transport system substrate-binding protein
MLDQGRRRFIALIGGAAAGACAGWPRAARAQQPGRIWRIGFIAHVYERFYDPLFERLRDLGYAEGQNLVVERRYAEGRVERFKEFAAEMVRLKVDIIIVVTTPAALAARNATSIIPIVHPAAIDPVGTGLITSLAHPGGNVTGLAVLNAELSAKRLEVLKEVVLGLTRVAVLWNASNPANALAWRDTEDAARTLGVTLQSYEVRETKDFESAFATMTRLRPDAVSALQDAVTLQHRKEIIAFALQERLPSMFVGKEWVEEGGLLSYGDVLPERYRRAAHLVDRILKGAKPADLPVEQPTKFELAVNLKTAKTLGLSIAESFLLRADQVIE